MRKYVFTLIIIIISSIKLHSQITFDKGYFINNSNKKIECLIKNLEWANNPVSFKYKLSSNDSIRTATIQTVKEFGIYNSYKYIRAKVKIDRSSDQIAHMSNESKPDFHEELLFFKVLVEGKASLYVYSNGGLTRFFYKLDDSEPKQLVYKKYLIDNIIYENKYYKQQLSNLFKCDNLKLSDFKHLDYNKKSLEKIFIKYNTCKNSKYIKYEPKYKNLFHLTVRPGLNLSNIIIKDYYTYIRSTDFGKSNPGYRIGIESEFIFKFNKNKWGLIIEPTFQYIKSEHSKKSIHYSQNNIVTKIDYKSIELPIGVRYYIFLNDKSKIFLNIKYVKDFAINSKITFSSVINPHYFSSIKINSISNFDLGVGYKFKDKYSIEIKYGTNRKILANYLFWKSYYKTVSIFLGYSIF